MTGRAVLAAHHVGLAEELGYLDEHLGARRGHGGVQHVSGQGVLAVGFDHRRSREGDPLLHTHLVIASRADHPPGRRCWALEGTGCYGAGLAGFLADQGQWVVEIDRPKRPRGRSGAKSDALDATRAGREALGGEHLASPRQRYYQATRQRATPN